jgi:hypothetical protein
VAVLCALAALSGGPAWAADDLEEIELSADQTSYDELAKTIEAHGHVVVTRQGVRFEAGALSLDLKTRKGILRGPVHVIGGPFDVLAESATFDLALEEADLKGFTGHWGTRAKFAGEHLTLGLGVFAVDRGWVTNCLAPEPDLRIAAKNFRFYPRGERMNLAGEGVALRVWEHDLLTLPYFNTTIDASHRDSGPELDFSTLFPAMGFDVYRGFLTGTRFDFSLGNGSRGSIPINFSSGRGWSAGIEHALQLGPGEISNAVNVETPWATGRGGLKLQNQYSWAPRFGGRLEVNADYRADMNGQPVHRIPDVVYNFAPLDAGRLLAIHNEVRAGYLWEESSGQQATRLRWAATCDTPVWTPLPGWRTWISTTPFVNHYIFQSFSGVASGWNHGQDWGYGLTTSQVAEFARVFGATPFIHDRQYDAERLRLGLNENWNPAFTTGVAASWSRVNQMGDFSIEDIAMTNTYRWNCFGLAFTLHPLIYGVEVHVVSGFY